MSEESKPTTTITVDQYSFNRDQVIAAFLIKMAQEDRKYSCDEADAALYGEAYGTSNQILEHTRNLALLEGYAEAWLNRWSSEQSYEDEMEIWQNMCYTLAECGPMMWD